MGVICRVDQRHTASSTFGGTENPISESGVWTNGGSYGVSGMQKSGGLCYGTQVLGPNGPPYNDSIAGHTGFQWGPNQWVIGTVFSQNPQNGSTTFQEIELWARIQFGPSNLICKGYDTNIRCVTDGSGYCQIGRRNGTVNDTSFAGDSDNTVNGITLTTGNVIALSVIGPNIKVYKATDMASFRAGTMTLINSATDTTYNSGVPGLGHWENGTLGAMTDYGWSFWQAADYQIF